MLNELNKNHMTGGVDNNGADSFYDLGDAWDRPNFPVKPIKVFATFEIKNLHIIHDRLPFSIVCFSASASSRFGQRHKNERKQQQFGQCVQQLQQLPPATSTSLVVYDTRI